MSFELVKCVCPCCGSGDVADRFAVSDWRDGVGPDTEYSRCAVCGSLYLNPRPTRKAKADTYEERYRGIYEGFVRKLHSPARRLVAEYVYTLVTGCVHVTLPREAKSGESLLDVGCGIGLQTKRLARRGVLITGIDTAAQAVDYARSISIGESFEHKDVFELDESTRYDYIRLDNVLEHVAEPKPFLARLARLLRPAGKLIIFTPCADSWSLHFLRGRSVSAWTPEHVVLYTREGLAHLLDRSGFEITKCRDNTPAWWLAYNLMLLAGLGGRIHVDSFLLRILSIALVPLAWIANLMGAREELVLEAELWK